MSVAVAYKAEVTVTETLADPYLDNADKTLKHSGLNTSLTLNANSVAPATKVASFQQALTAGAATIDLRALSGSNGGTVDGNGLKVQVVKLRNLAANANAITIEPGASNGFNLFGAAFSITLAPGQEITAYLKDQTPDVDATHKTLDLTGTGTQILEVIVVMG